MSGTQVIPVVEHNLRTGMTSHLDHRKRPCRTAVPYEQHHPAPDLTDEEVSE